MQGFESSPGRFPEVGGRPGPSARPSGNLGVAVGLWGIGHRGSRGASRALGIGSGQQVGRPPLQRWDQPRGRGEGLWTAVSSQALWPYARDRRGCSAGPLASFKAARVYPALSRPRPHTEAGT